MDTNLNEAPPPAPQLTAIEYLMRVMNDTAADIELRIQAAIALLPYMHKAITPLCLHASDDTEDD